MPKTKTNPKVDAYFQRAKKWQPEMEQLRSILLSCNLGEELKWGKPTYTALKKNAIIIVPFKESCALLFLKGALLKDPNKILIRPGENSNSARYIKFKSLNEIVKLKSTLKTYIHQAVEAEKSGLKVDATKRPPLEIPEELQKEFKKQPALKTAFYALTPGRQRAYVLHIAAAKQSQTRESRIEKHKQKILSGKGMNDE